MLVDLPTPIFSAIRGEFKVVIKNGLYRGDSSTVESILEFCEKPRSRAELGAFLGKSKNHVMAKVIAPLLENGSIKMTIPEKPKSSMQKFIKA